MAPTGNRFRNVQQLESRSSGEILQTLAYRLADADSKMALGVAIGDPLRLQHESTAVKVFWKEEWIGHLPRDRAALIVAEVPEAATALKGVVTGLNTTAQRDAFRLQAAC